MGDDIEEKYIRLVRLGDGTDLLAYVRDEDGVESEMTDEVLVLDHPLQIIAGRDAQGNVGVSMNPWPMFSKQLNVRLKMRHVLFIVDAEDKLVEFYKKEVAAMGSTIAVPVKKGLVLPS